MSTQTEVLQIARLSMKTNQCDMQPLGAAVLRRDKLGWTLSRFFFFVSLLCCVAVIAACNGNDTTSESKTPIISSPPKTSLPMPPLNGKSIQSMGWNLADGTRNAFAEFKGKVLILDFYATWCEPCRNSIPHLVGLQQRYQNEVRVIGLNVGGPGDTELVPEFAREFKIQYPLGLPDEDLVSLLMADSDAIPQTFVFDRKGQLLRRFVGFGEQTGAGIDQAVEEALHSAAD
jgi:thiol-disulfide isomerase/thioredoxin